MQNGLPFGGSLDYTIAYETHKVSSGMNNIPAHSRTSRLSMVHLRKTSRTSHRIGEVFVRPTQTQLIVVDLQLYLWPSPTESGSRTRMSDLDLCMGQKCHASQTKEIIRHHTLCKLKYLQVSANLRPCPRVPEHHDETST